MDKEEVWSVYRPVESIAGELVENDPGRMLEQEFGEAHYDLCLADNSKQDLARGSFELSYLVAGQMAKDTGSIFYDHRQEDFLEFVENTGRGFSDYDKQELIQFGQLYNNVAQDLELAVEPFSYINLLHPRKKEDLADAVVEMLSEIADELSQNA